MARTPTYRFYPPAYFLLSLIDMIGLHFVFPLQILLNGSARMIGLFPFTAGVGVVLWSDQLFKAARTAIKPGESAAVLVTWGPFRMSRNPMYAGMALTLVGVALLLGSLSPWLVLPLFVIAVDRRFIRAEEASLAQQFGPAYAAYAARVRRWL